LTLFNHRRFGDQFLASLGHVEAPLLHEGRHVLEGHGGLLHLLLAVLGGAVVVAEDAVPVVEELDPVRLDVLLHVVPLDEPPGKQLLKPVLKVGFSGGGFEG